MPRTARRRRAARAVLRRDRRRAVQDRPGRAKPRVQIGRREAPRPRRAFAAPTGRTSADARRVRTPRERPPAASLTASRSSPRGTTITGHAPASARLRPGTPERPVASLRSRRQPAPSSVAAVLVAAIATAASTPRARASRGARARPPADRRRSGRDPKHREARRRPRRSTRGENVTREIGESTRPADECCS